MNAQNGAPGEADMARLIVAVGRTRDVSTFEQVFRHFAPRVKAYMAKTGSSGAAAEELMQETMVAVWTKSALYDPSKGSPASWVFTIARNLRIDAYRRERHPNFDPDDPAFVPDGDPAADLVIETAEASEAVRAALGALPPDQAEVLRLSFFEDQSQSDIARTLDLPLGTVKSRMRLAFAKLRTALTGDMS